MSEAGERGGDMSGWQTLLYKEILRFWKVGFQTVAAPVLTALLYLMIFGHALGDHVKVYDTISYTAFLVPGLVMMSVLQNAFANSSSSLIQSKIMGNLVFLLLTPLSHWSWFFAYVGSSIAPLCATPKVGKSLRSGISLSSMKAFSRSNTSISLSVTSPCTQNTRPSRCMASSTA